MYVNSIVFTNHELSPVSPQIQIKVARCNYQGIHDLLNYKQNEGDFNMCDNLYSEYQSFKDENVLRACIFKRLGDQIIVWIIHPFLVSRAYWVHTIMVGIWTHQHLRVKYWWDKFFCFYLCWRFVDQSFISYLCPTNQQWFHVSEKSSFNARSLCTLACCFR